MKAKTIYIFGSFGFEFQRLFSHGFTGSNDVSKQQNIPVFDFITNIVVVVEKSDAAVEIEEFEGFIELINIPDMQPICSSSNDHRILHLRMDKIRNDELGSLNIQKSRLLRKSLRTRHKTIQ